MGKHLSSHNRRPKKRQASSEGLLSKLAKSGALGARAKASATKKRSKTSELLKKARERRSR